MVGKVKTRSDSLTPQSSGGTSLLGFDVRLGPQLELANDFIVRLTVRYAQHSGAVRERQFQRLVEFSDTYLDVDLSIGVGATAAMGLDAGCFAPLGGASDTR